MTMQRLAVALTVVNFALLVFMLAPFRPTAAQGVAPVLRGQGLELVDSNGRTRASVRMESPSGEVVFRLMDQQGTIRVKLAASEDGSGLLLANEATEPGVHMLAKRDGSSITVTGKDGRQQVIKP